MSILAIEFLGHSSFRMHHPCCGWIYLDPWIGGNPACQLTLQDVTEAQYVVVSHGHRDHLGDAIPICLRTAATLVSTPEICAFASRHGIPYEKQSHGVNVGGTALLGDLAITCVHAFHTSDIQGPQYTVDRSLEPGGGAVGFIFDFAGEHRLYYVGDSGVFGDMQLFAELYRPNLCILPIGGRYTMGPREAAKALEFIRPAVAIPCHHDTYPNQRVDVEEFVRLVARHSPHTSVVVLRPGELYETMESNSSERLC